MALSSSVARRSLGSLTRPSRFHGPTEGSKGLNKTIIDGGQKRSLVVEAALGHAIGSLGGAALPRLVSEDKLKPILGMMGSYAPEISGPLAGGLVGTTLVCMASSQVGMLGTLFLAGASVAGQTMGVVAHESSISPLTGLPDDQALTTHLVGGGTAAVLLGAMVL